MRRSLEISTDIVDLGPEMFASSDFKVISYKGENYYRACGEKVFESKEDGSTSSCIKPIGHLYSDHEDAFGRILEHGWWVTEMEYRIRIDAQKMLLRTGLDDSQVFNALNALQYAGFTLSRGDDNG